MSLFKSVSKLTALKSANYATISQSVRLNSTFKYDDMQIELAKTNPNLPDDPTKLAFGHEFTDHMLSIEWSAKDGWQTPKIEKLRNLSIHPAAKVLHYSVEIFEGMKAYYGVDKKIRLFRPDLNMIRFQKSTLRSALPDFDKAEFLKCINKFVEIEQDWIPKNTSASLYLRPTFIGTEPTLGVSATNSALIFVLASPTGPYFPTGFKPISLLADPKYVRAFPGGAGNVKVGSNYGPTIYVGIEAQKKGCQQVLWLFGEEEYLTEAGTMNMFLVLKNKKGETELITPPLDGTILEGVTRQSILDMTRKWGDIKVTERPITMKETLEHLNNGELIECFGAGTACVVCPIDNILYNNTRYSIPTMTSGGVIMNKIMNELLDIQYGRLDHEWGHLVQ